MLYKEGLPSGISLLPRRTREEPGSHRTAGVAPQAISPGPHHGGWEGDTPWLPLGTYPPTTLSDPYPEAQPQGVSREARRAHGLLSSNLPSATYSQGSSGEGLNC